MSFCNKCGYETTELDKFCPNCGINCSSPTETAKEGSKSSFGFLKIIFVLFIIFVLIVVVMFVSKSGMINEIVDPCMRARDICYNNCGEGVWDTITFCKDRCDIGYRQCKLD